MAVSQETLTIFGVGIALAGIIFASNGQLGDRIGRLEGSIDRLEGRIDRLDARLAVVERETGRIIGLLEGIGMTEYPLPSHRAPAEIDGASVESVLPSPSLPG